jgi:cell division protein FtsI/penicillin-binding protein 2
VARNDSRLTWRLGVLIGVFALGLVALLARLVQVQVVNHDYYATLAEEEHLQRAVERAPRGPILDRNGYPLVTTVGAFDIYIDPVTWEDDAAALRGAAALSPVLNEPPEQLISEARSQESGDYFAARDVPADRGLALLEEPPPGVKLVSTSRRFYPEGDLASSLLGFVGRDQTGLSGIESDFDRELGGVAGDIYFERDGLGNPIPFGRSLGGGPEEGGPVRLTIDRYLQRLVEQKLDAELAAHGASGGTIIIMDPGTGELLAMASRPSFQLSQLNLNDPAQADLYRNRAVTDLYDPGSVMKTVTMAMAIDQGLVTPQSTYNDTGIAYIEGGGGIQNWDLSAHGTTTATQVLQYSLNTGAVWLSNLIGAERFYSYMASFGFGDATNIGLGGESAGLVRTNQDDGWYPVDLATNSFGQGISTTPLQVITAISALVNGGTLMRPYIVKEVAGPDGHRTFEPVAVRRVISQETSRTLVEMMNAVVDGMPNHRAHVEGYSVGGKTGTTTFTDKSTTIASFVGFAPVEDPKFIMLVKIDEPRDDTLGGVVAAPVFGDLAPQILAYLSVPQRPAYVREQP